MMREAPLEVPTNLEVNLQEVLPHLVVPIIVHWSEDLLLPPTRLQRPIIMPAFRNKEERGNNHHRISDLVINLVYLPLL